MSIQSASQINESLDDLVARQSSLTHSRAPDSRAQRLERQLLASAIMPLSPLSPQTTGSVASRGSSVPMSSGINAVEGSDSLGLLRLGMVEGRGSDVLDDGRGKQEAGGRPHRGGSLLGDLPPPSIDALAQPHVLTTVTPVMAADAAGDTLQAAIPQEEIDPIGTKGDKPDGLMEGVRGKQQESEIDPISTKGDKPEGPAEGVRARQPPQGNIRDLMSPDAPASTLSGMAWHEVEALPIRDPVTKQLVRSYAEALVRTLLTQVPFVQCVDFV